MASQTDRPAVFSGLQEGALVLADISGYSKFVAQTEVDHSWSILHELLDTMVRSVQGRMDVSQVEGDAILFISGLSTPDVIAALERTFIDFHRRLRDMQTVTTCPCNACANIGTFSTVLEDGTLADTDLIAVYRVDDEGKLISMAAHWEIERTMATLRKAE